MKGAKSNRIFGLDVFRSCAILMVLVSHTRFLTPFFPSLLILGKFGFLGVELFFVLSGYLIGGILIKTFEQKADFLNLKIFWIRRWFRTMPNYYLFLLINIAMFLVASRLDTSGEFKVTNLPLFFVFLQNFAWPRPFFFRESWSLCVEEWFYLLYPIFVIFIYKAFKLTIKRALLIATFLFVIAPFVSRLFFAQHNNTFDGLREIVVNRLDAMMFGVLIAYIKFYHKSVIDKYNKLFMYVAIGLSLVVFYLVFVARITETFFGKTVLFNIVTIAFCLFLPYAGTKKQSKLKITGIFAEKISFWSYSLYLINIPVEFVLNAVKQKMHLTSLTSSVLLVFLYWSISIAVSAVIFNVFETPIMNLREKFN